MEGLKKTLKINDMVIKVKRKKIIRLDTVKDRISELEDRSREIIQNTSREIKRYKLWKGD